MNNIDIPDDKKNGDVPKSIDCDDDVPDIIYVNNDKLSSL